MDFLNCSRIHNRLVIVLTSLQSAWHNHGQTMHCMVRSSTMASWANTEKQLGKATIQLEILQSNDLTFGLNINGSKWRKSTKKITYFSFHQGAHQVENL